MSVFQRKTSQGESRWHYRVIVRKPDGSKERISGTPSRNTKAAAIEAERTHIERTLRPPLVKATPKEMPTVGAFEKEFMDTYVASNNKPSEVTSKKSIFKNHIRGHFGTTQLDKIGRREVEGFKAALLKKGLTRKTLNNVLTVLGRMLSYAEELEILGQAPSMHLVKSEKPKFKFLDFDEYDALLSAAEGEPEWRLAMLLAGSAGLRLGEIRALQWDDWDRSIGKITIHRSFYRTELGATKGWNLRTVPLTKDLDVALRAHRHLRGKFVVCNPDGSPKKYTEMRSQIPRLCEKAGIDTYSWHPLRHTFCSHLAMIGAPAKVIQELAGHADLGTTLKYMHLADGAKESAIALLENRGTSVARAVVAKNKL